jgi:hypothetical protein
MPLTFPAGPCQGQGRSTWQVQGGHWVPTGDLRVGQFCTVALHFSRGPTQIIVDATHGLSGDDVMALRRTYPNDVLPEPPGAPDPPPAFSMPWVPQNTVVPIEG